MATKKTYSDKLKSPHWQKKRLQILERDNWACTFCKDKETELQVHHLSYSENPWDTKNEDLITLCKHCHLLHEQIKSVTDYKFTFNKKCPVFKSINNDGVMLMFSWNEEPSVFSPTELVIFNQVNDKTSFIRITYGTLKEIMPTIKHILKHG